MRSFKLIFAVMVAVIMTAGCLTDSTDPETPSEDYRVEIRELVESITSWSRSISSSFIIVPQNGNELITENGEPDGAVDNAYAAALDGMGREDLFFG